MIKVKAGEEWNFDKIEEIYLTIKKIADEKYQLNYYPNQLEVISAEQMIDAYSSVGLPLYYPHWSFGEQFVREMEEYKRGRMGLAYEIVINSDPCIAYLMEENTMMMQTLVIAHASFGHNTFFANNYLFKQWTEADSIIPYLGFAKKYIKECEEKYGLPEVEAVIDAAHALQNYGVDKYKRPEPMSPASEEKLRTEREEYNHKQLDLVWKTIPKRNDSHDEQQEERFPSEPQENILYFIEKNAPRLDDWKREIIRIVRKVSQYFHPQRQCLTGNHLVSTDTGLIRLDKLITQEGYNTNTDINLLTENNVFTPISHTYLNRKQSVMRVTTESGRVFTGTPEHPLSVLNTETQVSELIEIKDMNTGDYLALSVNYDNCFSKETVKLIKPIYDETIRCEICGLESMYLSTHITQTHIITTDEYKTTYNTTSVASPAHSFNKSTNKIVQYPDVLTNEFAEFLSYVICNKPYQKANQTFTWLFGDEQLATRLQYLLNALFGITADVVPTDFLQYRINFNSFDLNNFLIQNFEDVVLYGYDLYIPQQILSSPKDVVASFIKGVVDNKATVRNDISSFKLPFNERTQDTMNEMLTLLIGLGIVAEIKKYQPIDITKMADALGLEYEPDDLVSVDTYFIKIVPQYKVLFERIIGTESSNLAPFTGKLRGGGNAAIIPNAKELLDEVIIELSERKKQYIDSIPNLDKIAYKIKFENKLLLKQQPTLITLDMLPDNRREHITLGDYYENMELFNNLKLLNDKKADRLLSYIESSINYYYDPIAKIEELEELHDVYDVTVPENHLFYVDGIISHNTQLLNEGTATFFHYKLIHDLYDQGHIDDGAMLEFYTSHTGVVKQYDFDSKYYSGINVYALGFAMFKDIERISMDPTDEDREWFSGQEWVGNGDWLKTVKWAIENFKDESFIQQFLSPKIMRDFRMFSVRDDEQDPKIVISGIHNKQGYVTIRDALSKQYNMGHKLPDIQVYNVNRWDDRTLTLRHYMVNNKHLDVDSTIDTLNYMSVLWGYDVVLESVNDHGDVTAAYSINDEDEALLDIFVDDNF